MKNVIELKKVEEALRIKDNTIESSINAVALANIKGKITYVNLAFLDLWGYDKEREVVGKTIDKFWQNRKMVIRTVNMLLKNGNWKGEMLAKRKNGSLFNAQISASVIKNDDDKPIFLMASFIDITKLKQAEQALKESEELYSTLIRTSPDGVVVADLNGNITQVSKRTIELFGFKYPKEMLGKNVFELVTAKERKKARAQLQKTLKEGSARNVRLTLLKKDNSKLLSELNASLMKDSTGKPKAFLITGRDITGKKSARKASPNIPKTDIMTVQEVAQYMRIHTSTIYRLVRENKIPAVKIGNQWRFKKNAIDNWLEKIGNFK